MALRVYGLRKCTTCHKAMAWLDARKKPYSFTDVKESSLDNDQIASWSKALGGWEKLINRSGHTWRGLPDDKTTDLTESRAVALALDNPSLIRRPLLEYADGTVTVGFSDKVKAKIG